MNSHNKTAGLSTGQIIRRILSLAILVLVAILPKIIKVFQSEGTFVEIIVKLVAIFGGLFLLWLALTVFILLFNAICHSLYKVFIRKEYSSKEEGRVAFDAVIATSFVIPIVLILIAQFIDSWAIKADVIKWCVKSVFPFI